MIEIYTDGSARKHGAECGYGVVAINDKILHLHTSVQCSDSTNNREEIKAIIDALTWLDTWDIPLSDVIIYSDSAYCVNLYNQWIENWYRNDWRKYDNKPLENLDLIKQLYELKHKWFLCPLLMKTGGHCGVLGNELADALATDNTNKFNALVKKNELQIYTSVTEQDLNSLNKKYAKKCEFSDIEGMDYITAQHYIRTH